jgi:uncharacterized protein
MENKNSPGGLDPRVLIELVTTRMPFGRYKDRLLCDLPVNYLEWFNRTGFPEGKLGSQISSMYAIKSNGLDYLLKPLKKINKDQNEKG